VRCDTDCHAAGCARRCVSQAERKVY
jgi:hypothetical protein